MGAQAAGGGGNRSPMHQLTQRKRTENDCGRTETKISCIHRPVSFRTTEELHFFLIF
jgi:hypothetical protein